jgi:hypothetical protein
MKAKLVGVFLLFAVISLNAYELNGDLKVKWTGFKTAKKVGVSGSFNDISLEIGKSDSLKEFLKSAKVKINTLSFDSGLEVRDKSIVSTLFSLKSSEDILGIISKVDTANKKLILRVTMNQVTKDIPMEYVIKEGNIVAKGQIDILDYKMQESFSKFAKACFDLHEGKSYSEVNIEFMLPFTK